VTFSVPSQRAAGCASDLDLDELLAGDLAGQPGEASLREHLDVCGRCRDRMAAFTIVEPPPVARVLARLVSTSTAERRRPRRAFAAAMMSAAAAAAVFAFVSLSRDHAETGRTKGSAALTVLVKHANGTTDAISGDGVLRPGDEMRFSLASAGAGFAVVLGIDAAPSVTIYVPAAPPARPVRVDGTGAALLPGSIVADDALGVERIVALVCAEETKPETLRAHALAALNAAGGNPERVSSLETGCVESSVLMRKQPAPP
jgi:hypothetical protein